MNHQANQQLNGNEYQSRYRKEQSPLRMKNMGLLKSVQYQKTKDDQKYLQIEPVLAARSRASISQESYSLEREIDNRGNNMSSQQSSKGILRQPMTQKAYTALRQRGSYSRDRDTPSPPRQDIPSGRGSHQQRVRIQDPKKDQSHWLSMKTGGMVNRFEDQDQLSDRKQVDEQLRKNDYDKLIANDRQIIDEFQKSNPNLYPEVNHSDDNAYMKHVQSQKSKQNLNQQSGRSSKKEKPHQDDYLMHSQFRDITQEFNRDPYTPLSGQEFLSPDRGNKKSPFNAADQQQMKGGSEFGKSPNIEDEDVSGDPYLQYIQNSHMKYPHPYNMRHNNDEMDNVQLDKLPGNFGMDKPVAEEGPQTTGRSIGGQIDELKHEYIKFMQSGFHIQDPKALGGYTVKFPCKDWIVSAQHDEDRDADQDFTPYKDMHYMQMINAIRADLKSEFRQYDQVEADRKYLQRSALKSRQLLSNSNCPGCQFEKDGDMDDVQNQVAHTCIIRLLENPNHMNASQMSKRGGMKSMQISATRSAAMSGSGKDLNFYRKVSKYELDRLKVDWAELARERQRQMKHNQEIEKAAQGAATQAKNVDGAVAKMLKIQAVNAEKEAAKAESKATALKKQAELTSLIKQVKEIQESQKMKPFSANKSMMGSSKQGYPQGSQYSKTKSKMGKEGGDRSSHRSSVDREGGGKILNLSLSPHHMINGSLGQEPARSYITSVKKYEGGNLSQVSEDFDEAQRSSLESYSNSRGENIYIANKQDFLRSTFSQNSNMSLQTPKSQATQESRKWKKTMFQQY